MSVKSTVVVDGSNVITANIGDDSSFRVNRIINVIEKLKKLGYTYKVGMKAKTYKYILYHAPEEKINEVDKKILIKLVEDLEISLLNKDAEDHWLHLAAIEFDAYILSHDKFRKEVKQWEEEGKHDFAEEIKARRVTLEFFEDTPIIDEDALPDISKMEIMVTDDDEVVLVKEAVEEAAEEVVADEETEEVVDEETIDDDLDSEPWDFSHAVIDMDATHIKSIARIGSDSDDWLEFDLPMSIPLGRVFFAELFGIDEHTKPILAKISREHLQIELPGTITGGKSTKRLLIKDLDSTNGTQIQGARVGKIGQVVNIEFIEPDLDGADASPAWPRILLGSRLLEIVLGAKSTDTEHVNFVE
tara:strand:- start:86 stop:1162 length:1077 start_codon:yes stop_codon:yes gene_type:complete